MTGKNSEQTVQQNDESIDKVLNSIKDVITNNSAEPNKDVLELTEKVDVKKSDSAANTDSSNDDILTKIDSANTEEHAQPKQNNQEELLNKNAAEESKKVLKDLIKMTEKNNADKSALKGRTSLEELVVEIIRPELSKWLNDNLPAIVTEVVQKEINKLIPKDE